MDAFGSPFTTVAGTGRVRYLPGFSRRRDALRDRGVGLAATVANPELAVLELRDTARLPWQPRQGVSAALSLIALTRRCCACAEQQPATNFGAFFAAFVSARSRPASSPRA